MSELIRERGTAAVEFRVLRSAEMQSGDIAVPFPGGIPGAVLAVLLIHQGTTVSVDRLIDMVWGDRPVKSAAKNVRSHVRAAREALPVADSRKIVATREGGYLVPRQAVNCDAAEFEILAQSSSRALRSGDPADAAEIADRALALWEGRPFEGVKLLDPVKAERKRLERARLSVQETSFAAAVRLRRHREVLPEMERLASAHPLREHLHALLMRALDQDGQQDEALAVYDRMYRALDKALGQPPGEELQKTQRQILTRGHSDRPWTASPNVGLSHLLRYIRTNSQLFLCNPLPVNPTRSVAYSARKARSPRAHHTGRTSG